LNAFLNKRPKTASTAKPSITKPPPKSTGDPGASTSYAGATPEEHVKMIARQHKMTITKDSTFPSGAHNLSAAELKSLYDFFHGGSQRFCWCCENKKLLPQFHDPEACPFSKSK
ncbi:hypothetical protein Vafri_13311, partial [Volvox africanus]